MKQILIYSGIYSFTAKDFINRLHEIGVDEDVTVRLNSPGGSPFAGWGMIAAINERKGKTFLKIDGNASSMAFFMIPFFDDREALDVTSFMVHRATAWVENEDDQLMLDNVNASLRAKLEKIIDKKKFKEITGVTIKQVFEDDDRRDIWLTAKQAKEVGLIHRVKRLQPNEIAAFSENLVAFSDACLRGSEQQLQGSNKKEKDTNIVKLKTEKKMTIEELKKEHPDLYATLYKSGITAEKDRIQAWMAFADVDMEAVTKGIDEGTEVTQKVIAEMSRKAMAAMKLQAVADDNPNDIETPEEDVKKTAEEKEVAQAEKEAFEAAGLKTNKTE